MTNPDRAQLAALGGPAALPGVAFPSAHADEAPGRRRQADTAEDLAALARVTDAALGEELMRRRALRDAR